MQTIRAIWNRREGDVEAQYAAIQKKLLRARERNDKLFDLHLDGKLKEEMFQDQSARLSREIDEVKLELRRTESEFLDLEGVLAFAERIITSPARLWLESSLDQRQMLQRTFFPEGLVFNGEKFGTASTSLFFNLLKGFSDLDDTLASPTGFEPVLSP